MSTAVAMVLLLCLRWLKPETTLAKMGAGLRRWSASVWSCAGRTMLGLHDAGSRGQQCEVVCVGRHVLISNGTIWHKSVKEGREDNRFLWDPCPHLAGRRVVLMVEALGLPATEVCHKKSNQFVSVAADHLDKEVSTAMVEARDYPSRNGEQDRDRIVPPFEAISLAPPWWRRGGATPLSSLLGRAERWGCRSCPGRVVSLPSEFGYDLSSSKLPGRQLQQLRDWRAPSWRLGSAHLYGGGLACEPIRPLGGGRASLPNGRCGASLVERLVWGVHLMVAVDVPHKPQECLVVLDWTGCKLAVEGLCNRLWDGVGFPSKGIEITLEGSLWWLWEDRYLFVPILYPWELVES